ncbi:hypothetical protein DCE79_02895 [Lysinibacillus sp. 2017]|uniref:hypothetical protein n=1 Tax=unclassified Lysinibacillus TaxID=2636778 RepID=UPI000D525C6A|nr:MULTISPECIES: hypothetical protein [unclassified Lysinibacillus]AWE06394.1 hypothetical protein DCE79_02895 [Lysinibacillus sp. 2017]TGN33400.1 hypothetical protein E4L99_14375 [Lysinibacillus sp. S2017]
MEIRVGGDFELSIEQLVEAPKSLFENFLPMHLNYIWTDIGRSAILLALMDIEKKPSKKVVHLPTYICDAVKQPFKERNYEIKYYSLGKTLNNQSHLPLVQDGEVFLFAHYFGHQNKLVIDWLNSLSNRNFFIIEDYVQSSLSSFRNNISDYEIFSFRKFTPQIDGALLVSKNPIEAELEQPNKTFLENQLKGKIIRNWTDKSEYFIDELKNSEASLNNKVTTKSISSISKYIMERLDFTFIKNKRVENWRYLFSELEKYRFFDRKVLPLFSLLAKDEVPLGFAVQIKENRDNLRLFLIEKNIFCPVHWPLSFLLNEEDEQLSNSVLTIPIDQRLGMREIDYIVECLKQYYGG